MSEAAGLALALSDLAASAGGWISAGDVERALEDLARCSEILDDVVLLAVVSARLEGASWAVIGDALGVSRQAAHARFHG